VRDAQHSPSLDACGTQAFTKRIQQTPFSAHFRAPSNIVKYSREPTLSCGWRTSVSPVEQAGQMTTSSSYNTCRSTSHKVPKHGSSVSMRTASIPGQTSNASSWEIFRACTCALGIPRISRPTIRRQEKLYTSTSATSLRSAISFLTSWMQT
jgi:hypothetical protein